MDMDTERGDGEAQQPASSQSEHVLEEAPPPHAASSRDSTGAGTFGAALIAGAIAVVVSLVARLLTALPTPAEVFGDQLTQLIPLPIFSRFLQLFDGNTKHIYYAAVLIGEALLTALVGALYWRIRQQLHARTAATAAVSPIHPQPLLDGPLLIALLWLLAAGIFAPLIGGGFFGSAFPVGAGGVFLSLLLPGAVFALCFLALISRRRATPAPKTETSADMTRRTTRRQLFRQAGAALAVLVGGAVIWEGISSGLGSLLGISGPARPQLNNVTTGPTRIVPPPTPNYGPWTPVSGLSAEVTSAADFYYVSKNLVGDPQVDSQSWRLQITGLVNSPYSLSYADLLALPSIEQYHTLECISNEVGGNLMSNGLFTGVSLAAVLQRAGIRANADEVIFHCADDYSDSLHLDQALDERSLIVYHLNGQPLPAPHGFPARLLIPGLYGMKNGKWLTGLELGSGGYTGYWEQRGWTREAHVKETARIDAPHDGDLLIAQPTTIAGVAYSGASGISRVEVSTDGGQTWQPANLKRPLGALTWTLWEYPWTPRSGQYVIAARTIDLQGYVQTANEAPPLPDGSSGYDAVQVVVR